MRCPKDYKPLKLVSNLHGTGYACPKCEGMLLTWKYIDSLKYNYQTDALEQVFHQSDKPKTSNLNCPQCANKMFLEHLKGFELDCCQSCHSIWFDKNELIKIIDTYGHRPSSGESDLFTFLASWLG
ncbi:MAG: zf-TFIIB domain-containing protein [Proteobacteria bacterium]|nr:zf-TFIIB domain-containing protein [Pseudomonadota bacterium]